jgi:hypothetical protein
VSIVIKTVAALEKMPTLHSGQFDNLKIETSDRRVWLSRLTAEDGETHAVTIEHKVAGRWETKFRYGALTGDRHEWIGGTGGDKECIRCGAWAAGYGRGLPEHGCPGGKGYQR